MKRLLDDPALSAPLRDDLLRASEAVRGYDALARLPQLTDALARVHTQQPGLAVRLSGRIGAGMKIKLLVLAALGGGGALWFQEPLEQRPPTAAAPLRPPLKAAEPTPPPGPGPQAALAAVAVEPTPVEPAAPQPSAARREIVELQRMRALLQSDPAGAYRIFRRSEQQFPNGVLGEERQALAVVVLVKMGQRDAAEQSARRFFDRYPESPLRRRLTAVLRE